MASTQEEQGLLSAFGSMMQDFFTGSVPSFVQGMMGPAPGEVDPGLLKTAEDIRTGKVTPVPPPIATLAAPTPSMRGATPPLLQGVNNPRIQNLLNIPVKDSVITGEDTPRKLAEVQAEEWDVTPYGGHVGEGESIFGGYSNPYQAMFESQIRANIPEGRDVEAIVNRARPGYLHAKGSYFLTYIDDPGIGTESVPTFFQFMQHGTSSRPADVDELWGVIRIASDWKHSDITHQEWRQLYEEELVGIPKEVSRNIFHLVKDDEDELALIAAREGLKGQGELGKRALRGLTNFAKEVDKEPVKTQKKPKEGYISKWEDQKSRPKPFSPMVYTGGRSRARVGGPGVEATGMGQFPTPQMIGSPGVESPRFPG